MSQKQRIELQPAWVLHHYEYRDTSRIAEFLVRDHGRVSAVARGVRAGKSRQRGLLQPFRPLLVSWTGKELGTVTGMESGGNAPPLRGDALLAGFYLNELCLKLLARHDPHPEVFDLYSAAIIGLAQAGDSDDIARVLRQFERDFLDALGYGLVLDADPSTGEQVESDGWYLFHPERGPERIEQQGEHPLCVSGRSLLGLARGQLDDPAVLADSRRLLRAAIDIHLGGRALKSRDVLRAMYSKPGKPSAD